MKIEDAIEAAYRNGYKKGYADGKADRKKNPVMKKREQREISKETLEALTKLDQRSMQENGK